MSCLNVNDSSPFEYLCVWLCTSQWFRDKCIRMSLHNLWLCNVLSSLGFWDLLSAAGYQLNIAHNPNLYFFNRFVTVHWYTIQPSSSIKQQLCTASPKSISFHKCTCTYSTYISSIHGTPLFSKTKELVWHFGKKKVFHYWSITVLRSELQFTRQSFSIAHSQSGLLSERRGISCIIIFRFARNSILHSGID